MRDQLEALRSDYTNPLSSRDLEQIDDQIFESELNLQLTVSPSLWSLYARSGEEGVRDQHAARELEEAENLERRYIQLMRREWYVDTAAVVESERREANELAARGEVSKIQERINKAQDIIAGGLHGEDLIDREHSRLNIEIAHECLLTLRAALTVAEAVDPVEAERRRAAARRREVHRLEAQLESTEEAFEQSRVRLEHPTESSFMEYLGQQLYLLNLRERTETQDAIEALRALGLGDPSEQDSEAGDV